MSPVLLAVDFNRKAIDIDRCVTDSPSTGGEDMPLDAASKSAAERFDIGGIVGEDVNQSRLRRLTGLSLRDDLVARSIPDRDAKRGVVGEAIKVILCGVAECHGEDSLTNEFVDAVANASGVAWVEDVLCDRVNQAEAMLGIAKQNDARIGRESLIGGLNFD